MQGEEAMKMVLWAGNFERTYLQIWTNSSLKHVQSQDMWMLTGRE